MKRRTKILLTLGGILVAAGLASALAGLAMADFRLENLSTQAPARRQELAYDAGEVAEIRLEAAADDVRVEPSEDGRIHLALNQREARPYDVELEDGVLTVRPEAGGTSRLIWFGFHSGASTPLVLSLPADFSGDLAVGSDLGEVALRDVSAGVVMVSADAGAVAVTNLRASQLTATVSMGDLEGSGWRIDGAAAVAFDAGEVALRDVTAADLRCTVNLGDIRLERVTADSVSVAVEAGETVLDHLRADEIELESDLGDIRGTIEGREEAYTIQTETDLGESSLPDRVGTSGRTLTAYADTGDIDLRFTD